MRGRQDCEKCGAETWRDFDILHCTNPDCLHTQYNDGWKEELDDEHRLGEQVSREREIRERQERRRLEAYQEMMSFRDAPVYRMFRETDDDLDTALSIIDEQRAEIEELTIICKDIAQGDSRKDYDLWWGIVTRAREAVGE